MKKYAILFSTVILFVLSGCSNKIYFNETLKTRMDNYNLSINKVQFYTSEKIVLRREIPQASAAVTNGQIHFERGKYIEEVSIKKNTPGTCEFVDHGVLHMSFENDNNKTFKFRIDPSGKFYYLLTFTGMHGEEYLRYDTIQYQVKKGDMTKLWVRKDQGYIFKATHRVIPGKTIDQ
ncbi:MAG: hypothetical protein CL663_07475 [Bacteroidetes bacterium]|nr:hypothetical protein [Bacteroidota bacterium]